MLDDAPARLPDRDDQRGEERAVAVLLRRGDAEAAHPPGLEDTRPIEGERRVAELRGRRASRGGRARPRGWECYRPASSACSGLTSGGMPTGCGVGDFAGGGIADPGGYAPAPIGAIRVGWTDSDSPAPGLARPGPAAASRRRGPARTVRAAGSRASGTGPRRASRGAPCPIA